MGMLQQLYWHALGKWLWDVFRHGPPVLGGWTGLADEEVCARLASNTHAADWLIAGRPNDGCTSMLARAFYAFCVPVHTLLYVLCAWLCIKWITTYVHHGLLSRRVALELRALCQQPVPFAPLTQHSTVKTDCPAILDMHDCSQHCWHQQQRTMRGSRMGSFNHMSSPT